MLAGKGAQILKNLREKLKQNGLNGYLLFHGDAHQSEYLAECDERVAFLSGFTGSNGLCFVTQDENNTANEMALMWTDGRYYLQAGKQLYEGWNMMKMEAGEPHYSEWIRDNIKGGIKIGCDEQQIPAKVFEVRSKYFAAQDIQLVPGKNLVDEIWEDRPSMPQEPVWVLDDKYAGESVLQKYERVGQKLDGADMMIISTLDDIAWFLNMRGNDIMYNPLFFSYLLFHNKKDGQPYKVDLFINKGKVAAPEVAAHLQGNNVTVYEYAELQEKLKEYGSTLASKKIVVDQGNLNYFLNSNLENFGFELVAKDNICEHMKAMKNKVQMEGMRQCNIRDCAAIMKYFAFLEQELQKENHGLNEFTGAQQLLEFRKQGDLFRQPSFESISSMGPNGAVIHYSATAEDNLPLNRDEIYLLDSGGQYLDGTTDITRTTHFGGKAPTDFQKEAYTRVLLGVLDLEKIVWPKGRGFSGKDFDILARRHLFEAGLDYKHGTGHGVGSMLCVHEGPIGVSRRAEVQFSEGMCVSDEPGYYQDGEFGIRIENVIMVVQHPNYEDRLMFENLTVAPYARQLLDLSIISDEYLDMINKHHAKCRDLLSPLLEGDLLTKSYLERACAPIIR